MRILVGLIAVSLVACGDDGGKGSGDGGAGDGGGGDAAPVDGATDGAMADAPLDGPPGTTALKVKNYLNWCTVKVGGGAESTDAVQNVNVTPGAITLVARGRGTVQTPTFIVAGNMWHHTDGDTNNMGETGVVSAGVDPNKTSTATVTVGATAACVWVCCPFPNGTGCEFPGTVPEQCP